MAQATSSIPETLTAVDRVRLARLVEQRGVRAAAERLGVGREVLARACANLPIRRGSIALLVTGLREIEAK